jgi:hypothetical protein
MSPGIQSIMFLHDPKGRIRLRPGIWYMKMHKCIKWPVHVCPSNTTRSGISFSSWHVSLYTYCRWKFCIFSAFLLLFLLRFHPELLILQFPQYYIYSTIYESFHLPSAGGKIRSIKQSSDLIGNRTRDFPLRSTVPQSTTLKFLLHLLFSWLRR